MSSSLVDFDLLYNFRFFRRLGSIRSCYLVGLYSSVKHQSEHSSFISFQWCDDLISHFESYIFLKKIYNVMVTCRSTVVIASRFLCIHIIFEFFRIFFEFFRIFPNFFEFFQVLFRISFQRNLVQSVLPTQSNFIALYNTGLNIQIPEISSGAMT